MSEEYNFELNTTLSAPEILGIGNSLRYIVEESGQGRGSNDLLTENECREILTPLVEDGKQIQTQLLEHSDLMSYEEKIYFESLEDEELAIMSMIALHLSEDLGDSEYIDDITGMSDNQTSSTMSIDIDKVRSCVGVAIGIASIEELCVKRIITATTLRKAIFAIARRYAGFVGVAWMVWDLYDCFVKK